MNKLEWHFFIFQNHGSFSVYSLTFLLFSTWHYYYLTMAFFFFPDHDIFYICTMVVLLFRALHFLYQDRTMCIRELHFFHQQLVKKGDKMMQTRSDTLKRHHSKHLMDIILKAYNISKALEYSTDGLLYLRQPLVQIS